MYVYTDIYIFSLPGSFVEFSRQEYWSGLPFPSPEDLPNPGTKPGSPALQADSLPYELQGSPCMCIYIYTHTYTYIYDIMSSANKDSCTSFSCFVFLSFLFLD